MFKAARVLAAGAVLACAVAAHGQTLDLDSIPEASKWGCVEGFEKRVSERLAASDLGDIERELLRLGAASLKQTDDEQVLWGVTLIERAAEVERRAVELCAGMDEAQKRTMIVDLQRIGAGTEADAARLLLNRALAPVIRKELEVRRSKEGGSHDDEMGALEGVAGLALEVQGRHAPEDAVVAAQQLEDWLKAGSEDSSLAMIASDTMVDAAAARKVLAKFPAWLSVAAVEAFEDALWLALTAGPAGSQRQAEAMALVGAFSKLVLVADGLPKGAAHDVLCRALEQACRPGLFAAPGANERLVRAEAWIELAVAAERDRVVVPPLRPAFEAAMKDLDRSRIRMMAIGGVIASSGRSATDPEFLAAKASHVELKQRVDLISRASNGLASTDKPGNVDKRYTGVASRMLKAWKVIGRKDDAASEAAMFTALLHESAAFARMPREESFVNGGTERDLRIAAKIKSDRDAWVKKVSNPRMKEWGAESIRLHAASEVLNFLAESLAMRTERRATLDKLNAMAGWQMSERVWNGHVSEIQRSAKAAMEALSNGESEEALANVRLAREAFGSEIAATQAISDRGGWLELVRDAERTAGGGIGIGVGVGISLRSWEP